MDLSTQLLLLAAGLIGGTLNALAGGGSFVTFPALLLAGVAPIAANASNTFASCAGYLSGAWALRKALTAQHSELPRLLLISLLGGAMGAWLLLQLSATQFRAAIPWLLLLSTLVFVFGERIYQAVQIFASAQRSGALLLLGISTLALFAAALYGGFFNAGLGMVLLSVLSLSGYRQIHTMNALKLLLSCAVSLSAVAVFIRDDLIDWRAGGLVMIGSIAGAYLAARLSYRLSQPLLRRLLMVYSLLLTAYFFWAGRG